MAAELRLDEGVGDGAETEESLELAPEGDSERRALGRAESPSLSRLVGLQCLDIWMPS
jgi:hypothetical protein